MLLVFEAKFKKLDFSNCPPLDGRRPRLIAGGVCRNFLPRIECRPQLTRERGHETPTQSQQGTYVSAQHASVDTCTPPPLPKEQTLTRRPLGESLTRLLRDRGRGLDGGPSFGWNDQLSILLFASRILVSFSFPSLSIIHEKCRLRNMILRIRATSNSILSIFSFPDTIESILLPSFDGN